LALSVIDYVLYTYSTILSNNIRWTKPRKWVKIYSVWKL